MNKMQSSNGFNLIEKSGYWQIYPLPTEEELSVLYESEYYQNAHGSYELSYTEAELKHIFLKNKLLSFLLGEISNNDSVLDVACGEGFLLHQLYKDTQCKILGIDYSDYGIKKNNPEIIKFFKKGDIFKSLNDLLINKLKFDFIFLRNVLEHVREPEILISKLSDLLNINGKLLITVPNDFSWLQMELKRAGFINRDYWVNAPEHLNYFTEVSLMQIVNNSGLEAEHLFADFPIEWLNANLNANYIMNPNLGKEAHRTRVYLENLINERDIRLAANLWKSLGEIGLGRVINLIAKKLD
jgi:SAM-dependent methyltransferase